MRSGINDQTETSEILVKGETGYIVEQMGNHNIGNSIAKRKTFILRKLFEDFFSGAPYGVIIMNYMQRRFDFIKKFNGKIITRTVSEKRNGFADNVPGGLKDYFVTLAEFEQFTCAVIVGVIGA